MDLTSTQNPTGESARVESTHDAAAQVHAQAAHQQAELEILQQVERGELTPQEALLHLSNLDSE